MENLVRWLGFRRALLARLIGGHKKGARFHVRRFALLLFAFCSFQPSI